VIRRARPALGTLVELGAQSLTAIEAGFAAIGEVERLLSKFSPSSDIGRFNEAPAGAVLDISDDASFVLQASAQLFTESDGAFDVTQGSGPRDWSLVSWRKLRKHSDTVRIDLGGIAKGHAVDRAFEAMRASGPCWVNAGGDLRVHGVELPIVLRDEISGGARPWIRLSDGAIATSYFASGRHVSVTAPLCIFADALTKVAAAGARIDNRYEATVWVHH
jgi:thiamine biosynthesis lipoprotein